MNIPEALAHLKRVDPKMKHLIKEWGPPRIGLERDPFESLLRAIIFQQLSGRAAGTIFKRFRSLFNESQFPDPEAIRSTDPQILRSAGLSGQKVTYVQDLSEKWNRIGPQLEQSDSMSDDEIRRILLTVKGIGPWTVDMFLMFTLNRPDVFPSLDLGIQKGYRILYGKRELPSREALEQAAEKWRPYRTVAAWYLWKVVDGPFAW